MTDIHLFNDFTAAAPDQHGPDLYFSPLKPEHAFDVNDKSAALNTAPLPIHLLKFDDVKGGAVSPLDPQQDRTETLFGFKILLSLEAVAEAPRITADWRLEFVDCRLEIEPLLRTTGRARL